MACNNLHGVNTPTVADSKPLSSKEMYTIGSQELLSSGSSTPLQFMSMIFKLYLKHLKAPRVRKKDREMERNKWRERTEWKWGWREGRGRERGRKVGKQTDRQTDRQTLLHFKV